ncbi:MAG TPA: hypothetical protein PLU30_07665 [Verrucomicrobiae bacterium]|nr:hypothetical protein [Verrucomicrobiae bacterium]
MHLDVRIPIGAMFTAFGALLTLFGLFSKKNIYAEHCMGININFLWGLVLLLFGVGMLLLAWRGKGGRTRRDP